MTHILALLTFLLVALPAYSKTVIISDVDDTVRSINRYGNYLEQLSNVMDPQRAFRGLSPIYNYLDESGAEIYYVSGGVDPLIGFATNFLEVSQFPQAENFYHRAWFEDTVEFKMNTITDILASTEFDTLLLFGDNGEQDVLVYEEIAKTYPQAQIFIHKLYEGGDSVVVPQSQNIFLTGADLALQLEKKGLLPQTAAKEILESLILDLQANDTYLRDLVLPTWAQITPEDLKETFIFSDPKTDNEMQAEKIRSLIFP